MASAVPYCDICQLRNVSKQAVTWCSECEESLCSDCNEHHGLAKATRNHKTILISDYQSLPASALDIKHYCEDHSDKLEFYCPSHATACCVKCIESNHHRCPEIKSLRDAIKDVKSSAVVLEYESDLSEILNIFKRVKGDKVKNLEDIDQQASKFKKDIHNLRLHVDSHLDVLEKNVLSSLELNKSNCKGQISKFTSLLDEKTKQIENTIDNITKYKQHASELQTFLGLREIEKTIKEEKEFVRSMESRSDFQNFELTLKVSPAFESFNTSVMSLGSVEAEKKNSSVRIALKSDKQAQIQRPHQIPEIDDIDKVSLTKTVEFNCKERVGGGNIRITGCEILENNKILLANQEGKELLMYTEQGKFELQFKLSYEPFDICYINNQNIAISSGSSASVYIYDTESRKILNQVTTNNRALGLSFYDKKIFCRVLSVGIMVFSITLEPISEINIASSSTTHISVSSGRIYYPKKSTNSVSCCDMNGKEIWRVTAPVGYGIFCSRNGCVFVTDSFDDKVSLVSNDGKKVRNILKSTNGLNSPNCVHFRYQSNKLLVCNQYNGRIFMYNINVI